jgi:hypothetical protein
MNKSELKDLIKEMLQDQHPLPQDTHATDLNELFDNSVMIQTSKGPYKFWADEDREEDNIKLFHYVKGPDGKEHDVNISPYEINWKSPDMIEKVKKWIESDMPNTKISENNLQENKTTMKKSELKALLKVIVQEVVATKQKRIDETKRLSGFKKPSKSKNMGSLKEDILGMIREAIDESDIDEERTKGTIGSKFKVQDASSPTGWAVKGHKTIPDGTPTEAPKGPYQKLGSNPNIGRPKKDAAAPSTIPSTAPSTNVGSDDNEDDDEDDGDDQPMTSAKPNSKVIVKLNGKKIGNFDFRLPSGKISADTMEKNLYRIEELVNYNLTPSVEEKYQALEDLFYADKLLQGSTLDLVVDKSKLGDPSVVVK